MKYTDNKTGTEFSIPANWQGVTFSQLRRMTAIENTLGVNLKERHLISVFTPYNSDSLRKEKRTVELAILESDIRRLINTAPVLSSDDPPGVIQYNGKPYSTHKLRVEDGEYGQYEDLKLVLAELHRESNNEAKVMDAHLEAVAIYLQPHTTEDGKYDYDQVKGVMRLLEGSPCEQVMQLGGFFFQVATLLLNGITPNYRKEAIASTRKWLAIQNYLRSLARRTRSTRLRKVIYWVQRQSSKGALVRS